MSNILWYVFLVIIGIALIIYTLVKKGNLANLLSFYFAAVGVAYVLEFFVLIIFNAYVYKPGVFSDPFAENVFAHMLTNMAFWGGIAIFVSAFSLKSHWIILISIAFMLIEVLFLNLGLYEHHWWNIFFTGIGSFVYFTLMKKWYSMILENNHKFLLTLTFYFDIWLLMLLTTTLFLLLGKLNYRLGFYENIYRDNMVFTVAYHAVMAFVYYYFMFRLKKRIWIVVPIALSLLSDAFLAYIDVLNLADRFVLYYLTFVHALSLPICIFFAKYAWKTKPARLR